MAASRRMLGDNVVRWPDPEHGPWSIDFRFETIAGRTECVGFEVLPSDGPKALTATVVKSLPFGRLSDIARRLNAHDTTFFALVSSESEQTQLIAEAERYRRGPGSKAGRPALTTEHLRAVADVYVKAYEAGSQAPVKQVSEVFHCSRSTATGWIRRARAAGILGPTEKRRPGGEVLPKLPSKKARKE
jgi:hypothetical protein